MVSKAVLFGEYLLLVVDSIKVAMLSNGRATKSCSETDSETSRKAEQRVQRNRNYQSKTMMNTRNYHRPESESSRNFSRVDPGPTIHRLPEVTRCI